MKNYVAKMFNHHKSQVSETSLFAFTTASTPLAICLIVSPVLAQSSAVNTSFPVPQSVPSGTQVRINGTTSMEKINQALAQQFQTKFPNTKVTTAYDGTDASLKALPNGQIDLAAIGRSLTESETAQGLASTPMTRNKIAVIVGKDNPYINNLTSEQFAQIFRGDVTDWSQVGGSAQKIRLIDRPENSELRQAFQNYPVFQKAPFKTGTNAIEVSADSTEAVVKELGTDGIGYAIADGVINNPNVKILRLHNVLPTDPRYPFSQPLGYAYDKFNPSPAAQAFLGFANAPANGRIIEQARVQNAIDYAPPEAIAAPEAATALQGESSWWWLLLIPLLGGLLWWLLSRRTDTSTPTRVTTPVVGTTRSLENRIVAIPRSCRDVYAYWEVSDEVKHDLQRQGGRSLKLRLYDVTDIDINRQTPHSMKEFDVDERAQDIHLPIALDNRDYAVELGCLSNNNHWLKIARSAQVRVPACEPVGDIPKTGISGSDRRIILVPRNARDAYAYWEIPDEYKAAARRQGGRRLMLRIHDVTNLESDGQPPHSTQEYPCDEHEQDKHVTIPASQRDYLAEVGYYTDDNRWLSIIRSVDVHVPSNKLLSI